MKYSQKNETNSETSFNFVHSEEGINKENLSHLLNKNKGTVSYCSSIAKFRDTHNETEKTSINAEEKRSLESISEINTVSKDEGTREVDPEIQEELYFLFHVYSKLDEYYKEKFKKNHKIKKKITNNPYSADTILSTVTSKQIAKLQIQEDQHIHFIKRLKIAQQSGQSLTNTYVEKLESFVQCSEMWGNEYSNLVELIVIVKDIMTNIESFHSTMRKGDDMNDSNYSGGFNIHSQSKQQIKKKETATKTNRDYNSIKAQLQLDEPSEFHDPSNRNKKHEIYAKFQLLNELLQGLELSDNNLDLFYDFFKDFNGKYINNSPYFESLGVDNKITELISKLKYTGVKELEGMKNDMLNFLEDYHATKGFEKNKPET